MGHKLSPHKVGRIIALYFEGASEIHIAHKLKISQGAVSAYVGKFKTLVAEEGIHSAEKEYGVTDQVEALRSLALDLKKAGLTVDETKGGLKVELLFKHLGVKPGDYPGLMEACAKLESKGLVDSALKLNQLEKSTGMAYADIISHGSATHAKLLAEQQNLQAKGQDLEVGKKELADIGKQKKLAGEDLQAYLKQVGADMGRIKLV
ncbi:MAG: hypothetical protein Q8P00_05180, partial [Dehalococcoidia bacterium]|nr:hypothetical protein [Dehalococcoidia bacterium]